MKITKNALAKLLRRVKPEDAQFILEELELIRQSHIDFKLKGKNSPSDFESADNIRIISLLFLKIQKPFEARRYSYKNTPKRTRDMEASELQRNLLESPHTIQIKIEAVLLDRARMLALKQKVDGCLDPYQTNLRDEDEYSSSDEIEAEGDSDDGREINEVFELEGLLENSQVPEDIWGGVSHTPSDATSISSSTSSLAPTWLASSLNGDATNPIVSTTPKVAFRIAAQALLYGATNENEFEIAAEQGSLDGERGDEVASDFASEAVTLGYSTSSCYSNDVETYDYSQGSSPQGFSSLPNGEDAGGAYASSSITARRRWPSSFVMFPYDAGIDSDEDDDDDLFRAREFH